MQLPLRFEAGLPWIGAIIAQGDVGLVAATWLDVTVEVPSMRQLSLLKATHDAPLLQRGTTLAHVPPSCAAAARAEVRIMAEW